MKDICYNKNYLNEVVAKVDFTKPLSLLTEHSLNSELVDVIRKRYSIFEPQKEIRKSLLFKVNGDVGGEVGGVSENSTEINKFVFHGENREKTITITPESIFVTLKKYESYSDFKLDIIDPIEKVLTTERNVQINRTGLRFVNIFGDLIEKYQDLDKYFSPMISSPFSSLVDGSNCTRNILITEYLLDEIKIRVQSGIFNRDYPTKIKNKEFVIDIDAYIDIPHVVSDTKDFFDKLHKTIQEKFEAYITKDLREVLNG
jgi:uncharacterized protein (TIGR04255 family)